MYNKDILDELVRQFGEEKTITFCKMESVKNELIFNELETNSYTDLDEHSFERDWWKTHGEILQVTRVAKLLNKK